jgi:two-component system cell cycle response regulator
MTHTSTILIIDDMLSARETLHAVLTGQGYNLAFAENGPEGLEKAQKLLPDLIILDIMMPGMDGFEVCERLREHSLLAEVPIIMLTSLDDTETRVRGLEVGADDFVSKPFNRVELLARIRTVTRLNRYRRLLLERVKFDWVVDQSKDGYVIVDNQDNITYANPQARLFLGLPLNNSGDEAGIAEETFFKLAGQQYQFEPQENWENWPDTAEESGDSQRYLVRPESPTSNVFWLEVEALRLPTSPVGGRVIHLTDVTAQKMLERDMRGFHVMVSHKLRTPLAGILGSLKLLAQAGGNMSQDKVVTLSQLALENVERLYHSMGAVLEFLSTPFANSNREKYVLGRLETTVTEVAHNLGINPVVLHLPAECVNTHVALSSRAMELTIWEFLENAKKFHPQQTPQVEMNVSVGTNDTVIISVMDDGIPLSPEQLAQMWTPYYQADKYATGEIQGMGLGLAMVATMVREVGGGYHGYNRIGKSGLVVELSLPVVNP